MPLHAGPVFATAFHSPGDPADAEYSYARSHNPTWTALEASISQLEGVEAETRVFGSGLAAVHAVFACTLRPGDMVVLAEDAYFAARSLLASHFAPLGVQVRSVSAESLTDPATVAGARLVWVETPSNPNLTVTDIAVAAQVAHQAGALVAVDNTTATPLAQQPLALGADFSVSSDSKAMCGHSDVLLGHVSTLDHGLLEKIDAHRTLTGAVAGPMEAWLGLRSLATLPLRLERACANAQRIAEFLMGHAAVTDVLYPGLPSHPGHAVAAGQMRYFGPVLGFTLASQEAAEHFLGRATLFTQATSFGGVTSSAERRARWGHDRIAPGFVRLSAGCEDGEDLLEDLKQALAGA